MTADVAAPRRARLVLMASGFGSNAQAVIDACRGVGTFGTIAADVVAVICDRPDAPVLQRAIDADVEAVQLPRATGETREEYDQRLTRLVRSFEPDVVVLAGWMRILSMEFLGSIDTPVINLHPALPGELPGVNAIERAFEERASGRRESGVMVHLVTDEGVDDGPVLRTEIVPIEADDTLESFTERMHLTEHALLVAVLNEVVEGRISV